MCDGLPSKMRVSHWVEAIAPINKNWTKIKIVVFYRIVSKLILHKLGSKIDCFKWREKLSVAVRTQPNRESAQLSHNHQHLHIHKSNDETQSVRFHCCLVMCVNMIVPGRVAIVCVICKTVHDTRLDWVFFFLLIIHSCVFTHTHTRTHARTHYTQAVEHLSIELLRYTIKCMQFARHPMTVAFIQLHFYPYDYDFFSSYIWFARTLYETINIKMHMHWSKVSSDRL